MKLTPVKSAAAAVCALGLLAAVGCSSDDADASGSGSADSPSQSTDQAAGDSMSNDDMAGDGMGDDAADPATALVGPGCADYAEEVPDGAGSVAGMAKDPVATAASNNPLLTTLVAAVSGQLNPDVDLVDTLNGGEFTVFAPVDGAFAELPEKTVAQLGKDADLLSTILTYHVVEGQLTPDEVVGTQTTLQGDPVEVTKSGDSLMVNDASVVCGGVQTANATVYLIDGVLTPSM